MMLGPWRTKLADGRTLWIEVPPEPGPNMDAHILLMLLMAAAVIGLAAYPVVARLTRRLEGLRSSVDAWGDGQARQPRLGRGQRRDRRRGASFNAAADRVEELLAAHRTLLAHASHELRSPLTRLRLAVEMLAPAAGPGARPRRHPRHRRARRPGRGDPAGQPPRPRASTPPTETVDLLALAAEEAARAGAVLRPVRPAGASFEVQGSPRLLRRLIRNLVENAAKHGAPPVEVELSRAGDADLRSGSTTTAPAFPRPSAYGCSSPSIAPAGWAEAAGQLGPGPVDRAPDRRAPRRHGRLRGAAGRRGELRRDAAG